MRAFRFGIAALVGVVETVIALSLIFSSTRDESPWLVAAFAVTAGLSFIVAGLVGLWRRPESLIGFLLAATGYIWFVASLNTSNEPWVWLTGFVLGNLALVAFAALILAYPDGTLVRRDRWLIGVGGVAAILGNILVALVDETPASQCSPCPESPIAITNSPAAAEPIILGGSVIVGVVLVWIVVILAQRWRCANATQRRILRPVYATCMAALTLMLISVIGDQINSRAYSITWIFFLIAFAAVPLSFLAGIMRSRFDRASAARILLSLDAGVSLRDALADALHDPSLEIAYRLVDDDRWVDEDGRRVDEPACTESRSVTTIERNGATIAALIHDPSLDSEPALVDFIAAGAGLPLENVRLQAELRAQFLFLETVANTAPSLLVVMGTDGRILNQNRATVEASGLDDDEDLRGRFFWDVFIGDDEREAMLERFRAAAPDFPPSHYENVFTNARGETRVIEWGSAPATDSTGRVISIVAGGNDVTERTQREMQLQRERDITETLMQAIPSLVVVVDSEGLIVDSGYDERRAGVNDAFRGALGWDDGQIVRRSVLDLIDPDDAYVASMMIAGAANGMAMPERESGWLRRGGGRLDVAWTATPVDDVTGRTTSLVLISGIDVTERKQQEAEIRASRSRIIAAAGEARRRLERNLHDGAQQRLVSLSVSLRLAESLLDADPDAARKVILGSREELAAALEELRELARGIHPAVLTDQGLAAALEALAVRAPLPIEITVPPDRLPAPVEAAVYYVVSEAVTNVVKHAQATTVTVTVNADEYAVTVTIADDGVGGADPDDGTGLSGLRDRVAALDGSLHIESKRGSGTAVMAEIPLEIPSTAAVDSIA